MYLKQKTCITKIFIELKIQEHSRPKGGKTHLFKNNSRPKKFKNIQGFQGPVATLNLHP